MIIFVSGHSFSQKCVDAYYLTNEINKLEFIAKNNVKSYEVGHKTANDSIHKSVYFNDWFYIDSVIERKFYHTDQRQKNYRNDYDYLDSSITVTKFIYNPLNVKLVNLVRKSEDYHSNHYYIELDSIKINYTESFISSNEIIRYANKFNKRAKRNLLFCERIVVDSLQYDENNNVTVYRKSYEETDVELNITKTYLLTKPTHIDDILLDKDLTYPKVLYDDAGMLISKSNTIEKRNYIYNKYNQLVLVVATDFSKELNLGTEYEKLAKPNVKYLETYEYNEENYLLNKILKKGNLEYHFKYYFKTK